MPVRRTSRPAGCCGPEPTPGSRPSGHEATGRRCDSVVTAGAAGEVGGGQVLGEADERPACGRG